MYIMYEIKIFDKLLQHTHYVIIKIKYLYNLPGTNGTWEHKTEGSTDIPTLESW